MTRQYTAAHPIDSHWSPPPETPPPASADDATANGVASHRDREPLGRHWARSTAIDPQDHGVFPARRSARSPRLIAQCLARLTDNPGRSAPRWDTSAQTAYRVDVYDRVRSLPSPDSAHPRINEIRLSLSPPEFHRAVTVRSPRPSPRYPEPPPTPIDPENSTEGHTPDRPPAAHETADRAGRDSPPDNRHIARSRASWCWGDRRAGRAGC